MRVIEPVSTSIAAMVGWAPQGDAERATLVESWLEYERTFGGLDRRSVLSYAVQHFFANGGQQAYIVRLTDPDNPASPLEPNSSTFETQLLAKTGSGAIRQLELVQRFNLLCVPGETTGSVIATLQHFCQIRRAFLLVDSDRDASFDSLRHGPPADITGPDSINSALYFPWLEAPDPLQDGRLDWFPPSGFVAGLYARTDRAHGVWKAPAGVDATLSGATAPAILVNDLQAQLLNRRAVNYIRDAAGGPAVWGARTLGGNGGSDSEWKYVPVRRLALFLEQSIYDGTRWAAFEPNDESTWAEIRSAVISFMEGMFRAGAFAGRTSREAYYVQCDGETTSQSDIDQGFLDIVVGFAPLKPAEFVSFEIRQVDPYKNFSFKLKWDGHYVATAGKVSGLKTGIDMVVDLPHPAKDTALTLEHGFTVHPEFLEWANQVSPGSSAPEDVRRDVTIEGYSEEGQLVLAYTAHRCWVSQIQALPMSEAHPEVFMIESMTLETEGLERSNA